MRDKLVESIKKKIRRKNVSLSRLCFLILLAPLPRPIFSLYISVKERKNRASILKLSHTMSHLFFNSLRNLQQKKSKSKWSAWWEKKIFRVQMRVRSKILTIWVYLASTLNVSTMLFTKNPPQKKILTHILTSFAFIFLKAMKTKTKKNIHENMYVCFGSIKTDFQFTNLPKFPYLFWWAHFFHSLKNVNRCDKWW